MSAVSDEFRTRWAAHDVRIHRTGVKQFRHPAVGTLDLVHHSFTVPTEDHGELSMTTYTAEPGTSSEDTPRGPGPLGGDQHHHRRPAPLRWSVGRDLSRWALPLAPLRPRGRQ
ncbi:MmyB family transcriptional regulator [Modestobacter sp. SYSU DS0657]